ncbi:MAG TPA: hypothetical protein VIA06_09035 [Candidatus Dormibacteraeota bacterium]|jgi:hypothetical protein|nr:hypothetical protein [Candidatus Dormibacteraeota bacterium]
MSGVVQLRVGAARVDITPEGAVSMAGFASRTTPSQGVYRPLHLRVALFESVVDGERRRALIASADLLTWGPERVDAIRERIEAATGVPAAAQLLAATHSHSGPQATRWMAPSVGVADPGYLRLLEERLLEAAGIAEAALEPVRPSRHRGRFDLCGYRRRRLDGPPPADDELGPRDTEVTAVVLRSPGGDPVATLVHYTCHPVINDDPLLTDEYPGAAMGSIEEGAGGTALFLQGCCGDVNPLAAHRAGPEQALAQGRRLGDVVLGMLGADGEELEAAPVGGRRRTIDLPLRGMPGEAEIAAACDLPGVRGEWGRALRSHPERVRGAMPLELQRVDLARDLGLLAINAEVSVEYGLEAKRRSGGAILPVAYSNGTVGYTPTAGQLANGGYEAEESTLYYVLPSTYDPEIDPRIRAGIGAMIDEAAT